MAETLLTAPTAAPDTLDVLVDSLHRFTVDDVRAMVEVGALDSNAPVELECGLFINMPPPGPRHNFRVRFLNSLFAEIFSLERGQLMVQDAVILSDDTYYEPDLAILRPDVRRSPQADDVLLAVEVSDSTLRRDRSRKADVYAAAGIPELWIIALPDDALYVYREPHADGYRSLRKLTAGDTVAPLTFPDAPLDVSDLLEREI